MRTVTPTAARDTVAPTLHKAQETLTGTVLPTVRGALVTARDKSADLLDTDVAIEARRRGVAVVKAARGDALVEPTIRRWRFGLGMVFVGTGLGLGLAWLARRMSAPVDSYTSTTSSMPVPSGTDGGVATGGAGGTTATNGASPNGTRIEDIDLRSGAPTTS